MKQSSNCSHYRSINTKNIMKNFPPVQIILQMFSKTPIVSTTPTSKLKAQSMRHQLPAN